MPAYLAYGLNIWSDFTLPEFIATNASQSPDVVIQKGQVDWTPQNIGPIDSCGQITAKCAYYYWGQMGKVMICDGRKIIVDPLPGVPESTVRLPISTVAFAALLHQRGQLVLHASAVEIEGSAIALLGDSGWGKSTLAAILHAKGHGFLCDDIVTLAFTAETINVLPTFPQIKLWPDAVVSLGEVPEKLPRLMAKVEKRQWYISSGFLTQPSALKCLYILHRGESIQIELLSPQEAVIQLIRNSHAAIGGQLAHVGRVNHFLQCAELAKRLPVYRLKRPKSLELLATVAQLLEEHNR